jgi:putative ABC transport system substrate-binding protein
MRRRELIALLGAAAVSWPRAVRSQQSSLPVIGFLNSATEDTYSPLVTAFKEGLKSAGYVERQNIEIEYRWAQNQYSRLPELAADLISRSVKVIAATGGPAAAVAAKAATSTIPIVFLIASDPVKLGLVSSFNRPEGNATGVTFLTAALGSKRLELMRELIPKPVRIALLMNPNNLTSEAERSDLQIAATALNQNLLVFKVSSGDDIDHAFVELLEQHSNALLVTADPMLTSQRDKDHRIGGKTFDTCDLL